MKKLFTKGVLAVAGVLLSLALSVLALVGGNQSVPKNPLKGLTNFDEVATGAIAVKYHRLAINYDAGGATSTAFECRDSGEHFSRWINMSTAWFGMSGTSTQDRFLVQGATTTQPVTQLLGVGSSAMLTTGSTTLANTNLLNVTIATGTVPFTRLASTTANSFIEWKENTCVGIVVKNPGANIENVLRTATSGIQTGLGEISLSFMSQATSTNR